MFSSANWTDGQPTNTSLCDNYLASSQRLCVHSTDIPFYFSAASQLLPWFSDTLAAVIAPLITYWVSSLFFHILDLNETSPYLNKYRIHPSAEVASRNLVSKASVIWMVLFQQVVQTALGIATLEDDKIVTLDQALQGVLHLARTAEPYVDAMWWLDEEKKGQMLLRASYLVYWWLFPSIQFFLGMVFLDTYQYFFHRLFHVVPYLYKTFHSYHHRLYVPYAFGALYNHPFEGFLFDSLGAIVAGKLAGMTTRQALLFFSISTLKTVDDHCGYVLPWDPLQWFTSNNADYHDIHHQIIGIKSNFSQPFFIHWDYLLNTRMTREDITKRRNKAAEKSQ